MRFILPLINILIIIVLFGCDLQNPNETVNYITTPGKDIVINEVFHTSPSEYYAYSWIELYNPTDSIYKWFTQTQLDDSTYIREQLVLRFNVRFQQYAFMNPSYIVYDTVLTMYFSNYYYEVFDYPSGEKFFSKVDSTIDPGKFAVIVSNFAEFDRHSNIGPFNPIVLEPKASRTSTLGTDQPYCLLSSSTPGAGQNPNDERTYYYGISGFWSLVDSNEICLMRVKETCVNDLARHLVKVTARDTVFVDVVRFGNYKPAAGHDPSLPENVSFDYVDVTKGYSLARYKGYYATGSTKDIFYQSNFPIPGWYNQIGKR